MDARAVAAAATGERILREALVLFMRHPFHDLSLEMVARGAGVTVQTVIRRFGSKEGLIAAAAAQVTAEVSAQRSQAPAGDVRGAIANLMTHYESVGPLVIRVLEQEQIPSLRQIAGAGRTLHRQWVTDILGSLVKDGSAPLRQRRLDQLVVVTDLYVWKLLRLDLERSREETEATLIDLVERVVASGPPPAPRRSPPRRRVPGGKEAP